MVSEPRPKSLTPEAALRVGERVAEQLVRSGMIETEEQPACAADIAKHGTLYDDGYELAKTLERRCYWDCDLQMAEELDSFSGYAREEIDAAQKEWAERNKIQPPLPIGRRVKTIRHNEVGTITGIYEHGVAQFLIAVEGDPDYAPPKNARRIVNFEDVQAIEEVAA